MTDIRGEAGVERIPGKRSDFDYSYNTGTQEHTLVDKQTQQALTLKNVDIIEFADGRYKCVSSLFGGLYKADCGVAALTAGLARQIS